MELRVKQKMINGKKVMGIINENLKEIAPFGFRNIIEVGAHSYKYFICEKEDGTCSLYDGNGYCRISYNDGYKELKVLKYSLGNNQICVVAKKNDEVGILSAEFEWNNGYSEPSGTKVEVAYQFGKCDEIIEYDDETVQLVKHTKGEDRIGYWYHRNINELVEPKFLSYDYDTIKCKSVSLYKYEDENGDKRTDSYRLSDHVEYDKLTLNVELIRYSKLKNKKKVVGLKQKVYDSANSRFRPSFKFEDFIPAIYSNISYDNEKQIFFLEQTINGQVKKGFMGVTFDWHFDGKGCWIWGYPNLKIEVNVPCEYDDIKIIKDNYALVKKDEKYGLIKFSFGKSNGDWGYDNRKNIANGKCCEIVPCIYDSIVEAQGDFIGRIDNEERIITDFIDNETKQTVVIANNYNKTKQISNEVFLCDLENEKKEVVVMKTQYDYWLNKLCSISKISPCDNAEAIKDNGYGYLIKVTNDNVIDIYSKDAEKIEENVASITYDSENDFYIITKINGHIKCVRSSGNVIFTTDELGFKPDNLSVEYLKAIDKFRVINNNLTRIYSNNGDQAYENRIFSYFDALQTYYYTFVCYTEVLEDGLITKLSHVDTRDSLKETEILKGNFQVENIVLNGKRIIFSTIDFKTGQKKYGVIESQEGNICIDCAYNNIQFDSRTEVFICSSDNERLVFDIDGFVNENQNVGSINNHQYVKFNLPKIN